MQNYSFVKILLYFSYFCNLNDSYKSRQNIGFIKISIVLHKGCHPIVQTDGQSSALVQWVGFVRGGGQN